MAAITAQTDQEKAGAGNTKVKFTTVGEVDIYMTRKGSLYEGMGPNSPDNDLILDATTPFAAGSEWIDTATGDHWLKSITDSSSWIEVGDQTA